MRGGEGTVLAVVVDGRAASRGSRFVQIAERKEGVGNVFLVAEFHLPGRGEVEGVLAPEQADIVLVAALEGPEGFLLRIEELKRIADTGGIDDQGEKSVLSTPRESGDVSEGGVGAGSEVAYEEGLGRLGRR